MDINEAKTLIKQGESEIVEFKESFNDSALEAVGAFSNAGGGTVFIGVTDQGQAIGLQIGKKTIEDMANRIQEASDPRIQPSISILEHEEKKIIAIHVAKSTGIPISIRGRFYKRTGKTKQRMSHEEITHCMLASTNISWDAKTEPKTTLQQLDRKLIERFIQAVNKLGRRPIPSDTPVEELFDKFGLMNGGELTRAALLLFDNNPQKYFPSAFIKVGRFRSPTLIVDDLEFSGSLIDQLDSIMTWFRLRLITELAITGEPERDVTWEYPLEAIREAVTNLLCHRDFTTGAHSQIRLYDDRLEFWNAGTLPLPLTTDLLFHEHQSIPRNRQIANIFYAMGFIERWGSGTLRMVEELQKAGLPKPEFSSEAGQFKLAFFKKKFTDEKLQKMGLTERQWLAVTFVRENGQISNAEYQELASISKRTASRELHDLTQKGILTSEGASRGPGKHYCLSNT
jgi:ATP-dependent DNA helicase RecG